MPDYALLINGVFKEIRRLPSQPENIPHKNIEWCPVAIEDGDTASAELVDGNWVICNGPPVTLTNETPEE